MSILDTIVANTREQVRSRQAALPEEELVLPAAARPAARSLAEALLAGSTGADLGDGAPRTAVIAEVKRRSPSAGDIADVDPVAQARAYTAAGATAISVLTDERHFGGSLRDLMAITEADLGAPVLRKDFIVDPYQVLEARAAGADAVLLMASVLDDEELEVLLDLTHDLGMEALVESHTAAELERAIASGARILGINNRDLTTMDVSLDTTLSLAEIVPPKRILVSESGIATARDAELVWEAGARAVLVGEALMRTDDLDAAISGLRGVGAP